MVGACSVSMSSAPLVIAIYETNSCRFSAATFELTHDGSSGHAWSIVYGATGNLLVSLLAQASAARPGARVRTVTNQFTTLNGLSSS